MAIKATEEELDYSKYANEINEDISEQPSRIRSLIGAPIKGAAKAVYYGGQAVDKFLDKIIGKIPVLGGALERAQTELAQFSPTEEEQLKKIEELFPTQESYVESSLERGGSMIPYAAAGGNILSNILRSIGAGFLGEGAKELGAGKLGQTAAELAVFGIPNLSKRIPVNDELSQFARGAGLTEQDIALASGNRGIVRDFAEQIASKGGRAVRAFERTRKNLGTVWEGLRTSPEAQKALSNQQASNFMNNISKRISKLPAQQRNLIQEDFNDLVRSNMTGDDLINFYQDLNYYISKGDRALGVLKEDISQAMTQVSPELGKDFRLTNKLYGNFAQQAERMGPDIADRLMTLGESGIVLHAVTTGNFPLLKSIIGPIAGRQLALEMVVNPRFQRLSSRFISALNSGKYAVAKNLYNQTVNLVAEKNSEAANKLAQFDVDQFLNSIESQE